ncbi:Ran-specific GTPase-activating protein 2 [Penicillium rolfsii]|nr:Ran-specific GTPase-activating protein 2 [Penicillium rolfsii]
MVSASDEHQPPADATSGGAHSPPSDTDERPVRKQLKETSIDSSNDKDSAVSAPEQGSGRKRSFEEARGDTDDIIENGDGPRKRSRECTPEDAKKETSTAVPAPDKVSEPKPRDPVPATLKDLATDEFSPGICDGHEADFVLVSNSESEDPVPHQTAKPQEILEKSSESASESEFEIVEVPDDLEVISISDSESEPEEEAQAPAPVRVREGSFDSVDIQWLQYFGYTRENTPESEIPGAPAECPTCFPVEVSSGDQSGGQEHQSCFENDNTNTTSQDSKTQITANAMNEDDAKALKKKRSLEQLEEEGAKKLDETEKKRHRDDSQEREIQTANAFAQSAFATAAASSPFATLGGSSSNSTNEKPASTSAFASSALGSFAGSEKSPFGSFGASKPSVFSSSSGMSGFGASSTSGFGSLKSGFAGVGGGFAAAAKSGGLSNFASPNAPATLGGEPKPAKPIGADESGDEGSDNDEGEETSTFEADKTDERFYEQTIETGEEEEENLFACKGKLFHFSGGEWKERGVGSFKVNARKSDDGKQHGRMIMRADGNLRVMLNSPVFKGMTFGNAKNEEPTSKQIFLASNEEGRTVPLLLRVGNEALAKDLYVVIKDLLDGE